MYYFKFIKWKNELNHCYMFTGEFWHIKFLIQILHLILVSPENFSFMILNSHENGCSHKEYSYMCNIDTSQNGNTIATLCNKMVTQLLWQHTKRTDFQKQTHISVHLVQCNGRS